MRGGNQEHILNVGAFAALALLLTVLSADAFHLGNETGKK